MKIKKYRFGIRDEMDRRFWQSSIDIEISQRTPYSKFKIRYKDEEYSFYSCDELFWIIANCYIPYHYEFYQNFDDEEDFDMLVFKIEEDYNIVLIKKP